MSWESETRKQKKDNQTREKSNTDNKTEVQVPKKEHREDKTTTRISN